MIGGVVDWTIVARAALSLAVGAFVQETLGFGMGMVATPLLVWDGFTLPQAIGAVAPNILAQTAVGCWRFRRDLPWGRAWEVCAYRYLALPVGISVLGIVAEQGQEVSRAVLGTALILALAMQQFPAAGASRVPGRFATAVAASASGFLAGLIGMGGPPLVLWVMRQDWSSRAQRCFLWLSFLQVMPLQIGLMAWKFGPIWWQALAIGTLAIPITLTTAGLASRWADRWSKQRLRFGMQLFLLVIALRLMAQVSWPWFSHWFWPGPIGPS